LVVDCVSRGSVTKAVVILDVAGLTSRLVLIVQSPVLLYCAVWAVFTLHHPAFGEHLADGFSHG